jgi:deoxyribodipyrimidine photo-lyase
MNQPAQTELFVSATFEPTRTAALARLAAVRPHDYARTRNHLDGAVTQLSPYITHGLLTLPEVLRSVRQRYTLDAEHKFIYELAWREYFHHVWRHLGDGIFSSLHEGPLPEQAYAPELPADIRQGATGVPVIDQAVRTLYASGYLHNHARMWLASYVVHQRKVHWRAGADWLYGHLLDGDLASNHLSWQWVAGTGSQKPYLFNANNVARYAPPAWHSPGSVLDVSYEELDRVARSVRATRGPGGPGVEEPALWAAPPAFNVDSATALPDKAWLVHAWALGALPENAMPGGPAVGVLVPAFHARWPWSAARWQFVCTRMAALSSQLQWLDGPPYSAAGAGTGTLANPHWGAAAAATALTPSPQLFANPGRHCTSFSQFWRLVGLSASPGAKPA